MPLTAVLAMLLVHANQVVPADRLTAELWAGQPADRAAASLQVRVSQLRKALRAAGEADRLVTRPPGYLIRVTPGELDAPRMAASPSAVLRMLRMIREIDVRGALPGLGVPALVIQRRQDRITPPCHGRYLAAHLPGARYFEQPGDHLLWLGDTDAMFGQIREFLGEAPGQETKTDRRSPWPAAPAAG
jgi:pimeloyl-ACP methyl ester carboxylesterase